MYHHLRGQIIELSPTAAVVEASGVGYDLRIPLSTYDRLKGQKEARVFTHLHVREDELRLYGFATIAERELFRFLSSVSGVGPSIALAALCTLSPEDIAQAISVGDYKTLQRTKGVGRKLAERMALELRDRVGNLMVTLGLPPQDDSSGEPGPVRQDGSTPPPLRAPKVMDTVAALVRLGFDRKAAETRADGVYERLHAEEESDGREVDLEQLIKECLRGR